MLECRRGNLKMSFECLEFYGGIARITLFPLFNYVWIFSHLVCPFRSQHLKYCLIWKQQSYQQPELATFYWASVAAPEPCRSSFELWWPYQCLQTLSRLDNPQLLRLSNVALLSPRFDIVHPQFGRFPDSLSSSSSLFAIPLSLMLIVATFCILIFLSIGAPNFYNLNRFGSDFNLDLKPFRSKIDLIHLVLGLVHSDATRFTLTDPTHLALNFTKFGSVWSYLLQ